jgi:hypothetical protein
MGADGGWPTRLRGLLVFWGFAVAGMALAGPSPEGYTHGSIYAWWTWVIVGVGALAGGVLLVAPEGASGSRVRTVAACVALVVGAELAGTGVVAREHWRPASGVAGYGVGQLEEVARFALLIAVSAGIATVAAAWQLLASRELGPRRRRTTWRAQLAVGVALLVLLPVLLAVFEVGGPRLTTWGAAGLVYGGPWGVAVVASAWSSRPAAAALLETVLGCAALAAVGPQMVDGFVPSAEAWFVAVAPAIAVLIIAVVGSPGGHVDRHVRT